MDRSETTSDPPADPPTGPVTAPARPQALGPALRVAHATAPADGDGRAPIHRAPPRPLVPRAYRQAVRAVRSENGANDGALHQPAHPRVTAASLPPALAPLNAAAQLRAPLVVSLAPAAHPSTAAPSAASVSPSGLAPMITAITALTPTLPESTASKPTRPTASTNVAATPLPPAQSVPAVTAPRRPIPIAPRGLARRLLKFAGLAIAGYFALIATLLIVYRFANPPLSSLMLQQKLSGGDVVQQWTDIENISPQIVRAVLLSEDGRFCQHRGVDLLEMQAAIERAGDGGVPRGASTISMQVIKNLFLWPSKSYVRKAIEIPFTYLMELIWPKRRIMEVYLNIAEWGPGIFGVGAASQFHFDKAAGRLNEREAAQLAVALPNPYSRDAGDPGPQTRRLAGDIQNRMRSASVSQTACVLGPRAVR